MWSRGNFRGSEEKGLHNYYLLVCFPIVQAHRNSHGGKLKPTNAQLSPNDRVIKAR